MSEVNTCSKKFRKAGLCFEDLVGWLIPEIPTEAREVRVIVYRAFGDTSGVKIKSVTTDLGDLDVEYHETTDFGLVGMVTIGYVLAEPNSVHLPQSWILSV